jgi:hypothetical protein
VPAGVAVNSLGYIIERNSYLDSRHHAVLVELVVAGICDETTNLLLAAPFVGCSPCRIHHDKQVLEEVFELPEVSMIFGDIKFPKVSTSQNAEGNFRQRSTAVPENKLLKRQDSNKRGKNTLRIH